MIRINEYEDARDALIPKAAKYAYKRCRKADFGTIEEYNAVWNRIFHNAMNKLAKETGLITWGQRAAN